jgi:hypothetical protein
LSDCSCKWHVTYIMTLQHSILIRWFSITWNTVKIVVCVWHTNLQPSYICRRQVLLLLSHRRHVTQVVLSDTRRHCSHSSSLSSPHSFLNRLRSRTFTLELSIALQCYKSTRLAHVFSHISLKLFSIQIKFVNNITSR